MKLLILSILCAGTLAASAKSKIEPIHIEIGKSYDGYSEEELRRRVWQLERAVAQLQDQVFQLAVRDSYSNNNGSQFAEKTAKNEWTCTIQAFGKTHIGNASTRASALAKVQKKCSEASNAIHCSESEAKCSNE